MVSVITVSGQYLGGTFFEYKDVTEELIKQLVIDHKRLAKHFRELSEKLDDGNLTSVINIAGGQGNVPDHGKTTDLQHTTTGKATPSTLWIVNENLFACRLLFYYYIIIPV